MTPTVCGSLHPAARSLHSLSELPIDQRRGEHAMWCVISTEAMLFVCMFGSYYYLGTNKDRWADNLPPSLKYPFVLLAILLGSSAVLEWGKRQVQRQRFRAGRAGPVGNRGDRAGVSGAAGI